MKIYPVEFEITDDVGDPYAKFKAFDDESFEVDIKKQIISPDDLREIVNLLEKACPLLNHGYKDVGDDKQICTYPHCQCPFDMGEDGKCFVGKDKG